MVRFVTKGTIASIDCCLVENPPVSNVQLLKTLSTRSSNLYSNNLHNHNPKTVVNFQLWIKASNRTASIPTSANKNRWIERCKRYLEMDLRIKSPIALADTVATPTPKIKRLEMNMIATLTRRFNQSTRNQEINRNLPALTTKQIANIRKMRSEGATTYLNLQRRNKKNPLTFLAWAYHDSI